MIYITLCRCISPGALQEDRGLRGFAVEACGVCQFDGGDPRRGKARWQMGDGGFMVFVVGYFLGIGI
jgi:hypothetical protein